MSDAAEPNPTATASPHERCVELECELKTLRARLATYERTASAANSLAGMLTYGPGLTRALARWDQAYSASPHRLFWRRLPHKETLEVVAAYLRRRAMGGVLIAALAVVPGLVTLYLLYQQNVKIDQQIFLAAAAGSQQLQSVVVATLKDLQDEPSSLCVKDQALALPKKARRNERFDTVNRNRCWEDIRRFADFPTRDDWIVAYNNNVESSFSPIQQILTAKDLSAYHDPGVPIGAAGRRLQFNAVPSPQLLIRATSLSEALDPYRRLIDSPTATEPPRLAPEAFSPERGLLMRAFAANELAPVKMNFVRAWAPGAQLPRVEWRDVNMSGAVVECSDLSRSRFDRTRLDRLRAAGASFSQSDMRGIESAQGADFRYARFHATILPPAAMFVAARLEGASFEGSLVPSKDWLRQVANDTLSRYYEVSTSPVTVEGVAHWLIELKGGRRPSSPLSRRSYEGIGDMPLDFCRERRAASFESMPR